MKKLPHIVPDTDLSQEERELLQLLVHGEKEISDGKGYPLERVLKEADELLEDE